MFISHFSYHLFSFILVLIIHQSCHIFLFSSSFTYWLSNIVILDHLSSLPSSLPLLPLFFLICWIFFIIITFPLLSISSSLASFLPCLLPSFLACFLPPFFLSYLASLFLPSFLHFLLFRILGLILGGIGARESQQERDTFHECNASLQQRHTHNYGFPIWRIEIIVEKHKFQNCG